jgi:ribonuclease P protein component
VPHTFPSSHRLTHDLQFQAVYDARVRKVSGPLAISCLPNSLPHHRLGLSVGKAVGNAVTRTRCKRLVREAFRLVQHELVMHEGATHQPRSQGTGGSDASDAPSETACGFDIVVQVRSKELGKLSDLQQKLIELVEKGRKEWGKR